MRTPHGPTVPRPVEPLDLGLALVSFSATRALTTFLTRAAGRGASAAKRMVPFEVS